MNANPKFSSLQHRFLSFKTGGFSLVEVLAVVAIIALVASIAMVAGSQMSDVAKGEKIKSDVSSLNSAIDIYIANGGSLDGLTTPDAVLSKLKSTRTGADAGRHTGGPSGRMIDPRVIALPVADGASVPRAVYNSADKRFDIVTAGAGFEFSLDDTLNEIAIPTEARDHGAVAYAKDDDWVWDYAALNNPGPGSGPTNISVEDDPSDATSPPGGGGGGGGGGSPPDEDTLEAPSITPPGGGYPYDDYPLSVTISGNHDPGLGYVVYQVDGGGWQNYSGETLVANLGTVISAQAISTDPMWLDSSVTTANYKLKSPPRLPSPKFSQYGGPYPFPSFPMSITFTNIPDPAIGDPVYRLRPSGSSYGPWTPYTGPVAVPINTKLQGRYLAKDTNYYRDSYTRSGYYYPIVNDLGGSVSGAFHDPEGGASLVSEITNGGTDFSHGDPTLDLGGEIINAGEPNTLSFQAGSFSDIEPGETFKLGELQYHNGTTFSDSHATGVKLEVTINLTDPAETILIDLDFDLVNTENSDDADASADYVRLTNLTQDINLDIHGVNYSLQLEFGGTDSYGFSTGNQFHVYEGATGTGEINGTFVADP